MAWVRIHDGAMTHPKIVGLPDAAFRLWVWGLTYAQQHLTDGWLTPSALPAKAKPDVLVSARLWHVAAQGGFDIHDYLDWNDSREAVRQKRAGLKARVTRFRGASETRSVTREKSSSTSGVVKSSDLTITEDPEREPERKPAPLPVPKASGRQSGRIFLHRWQLDALIDTLGPHAADFGLDTWLDDLSRFSGVLPADKWPWIQAQLQAEVQRRGLPLAVVLAPPEPSKRTANLMASIATFVATNEQAGGK